MNTLSDKIEKSNLSEIMMELGPLQGGKKLRPSKDVARGEG